MSAVAGKRPSAGCYGSQLPGEKCNTCIEAKLQCTHFNSPAKRRTRGYVENLETRLERSEALAHQLRTEIARASTALSSNSVTTISDAMEPRLDPPNVMRDTPPPSPTPHDSEDTYGNYDWLLASRHAMRTSMATIYVAPTPPHSSDAVHLDISDESNKFSLGPNAFVGESSIFTIIKAADAIKANLKSAGGKNLGWNSRRRHLWTPRAPCRTRRLKFPADLLMKELIGLYFTHQQIYTPVLHRPTFERGVAEGLHWRDHDFGAIVLLVCAIGSRWSVNPSVTGGANENLACGREWFDQVPLTDDRLIGPATLHDLQYCALAVLFLDGACAPLACSTLLGIGLRLAQDIGVHVRKPKVPSVESELYKRAFFVLVHMDHVTSAEMGRKCALQFDEIDIDPLLEVDDEYWEHPAHPFEQPPGIPSRIGFFNALMRLGHIGAFCLNGLFSAQKVHALIAMNSAWEEEGIAELHSALDTWFAHVPEHLRWDPWREDSVFFDQSVALNCTYRCLQIRIHRSLMFRKADSPILHFVTIATTAARACADMVDAQRQRNGNTAVIINMRAAFSAGHFLLLHVANEVQTKTRPGLDLDENNDIADAYKCMQALHLCQTQWQKAGMLRETLAKLAANSRLPLPELDALRIPTPGWPAEHEGQHYHPSSHRKPKASYLATLNHPLPG
ncbi:hypothetical protein K438DRAFT_2026761, partial [Mycena galopus ATCC 62051]